MPNSFILYLRCNIYFWLYCKVFFEVIIVQIKGAQLQFIIWYYVFLLYKWRIIRGWSNTHFQIITM